MIKFAKKIVYHIHTLPYLSSETYDVESKIDDAFPMALISIKSPYMLEVSFDEEVEGFEEFVNGLNVVEFNFLPPVW